MKTFGEQPYCLLDKFQPYQRPKLSDRRWKERTSRMNEMTKPQKPAPVCWSAWLDLSNESHEAGYLLSVAVVMWLGCTQALARLNESAPAEPQKIALQSAAVPHDVRSELPMNFGDVGTVAIQTAEPVAKVATERVFSVARLAASDHALSDDRAHNSADTAAADETYDQGLKIKWHKYLSAALGGALGGLLFGGLTSFLMCQRYLRSNAKLTDDEERAHDVRNGTCRRPRSSSFGPAFR